MTASTESLKKDERTGRKTKRPEYDLPMTKGDKLDIIPIVPLAYHNNSRDLRDGKACEPVTERTLDANLHYGEQQAPAHTILDLFCGAGGMSLGFEDVGFRVVLGVDSDYWACRTFAAHIPTQVVKQDLAQITDFHEFFGQQGITHVTGIIGGPPCQGFSRVGKGRIRHQNRLNGNFEEHIDPRNGLYRQFLTAVDALRPQFFVMENVPDLDAYEDDEGLLADRIQESFVALGYHVDRRVLSAADFGVPQTRSRLFFIGLQSNLGLEVRWPDNKAAILQYGVQSLRAALGDLPLISAGQLKRELPYQGEQATWLHRWYRQGIPENQLDIIYDHITRPHRLDDQEYFRQLGEGQRFVDLPEDARRYRSDIFKDKYRKLKWDAPAWTITAHLRRDSYRYIHPQMEPPRTISVREAARLQSFPDRWRFCGHRSNAFSQIGNAVPPLLARAVARIVMAQLTDQELPDPLFQEDDVERCQNTLDTVTGTI